MTPWRRPAAAQYAGPGLARTVQPRCGLLEPSQADVAAPGVVESPLDHRWLDHRPQVAQRARQTGASDAGDRHEVRRIERVDVVNDDAGEIDARARGHAELDDARRTPVETEERGCAAMGRGDGARGGEHCSEEVLLPRAGCCGEPEHGREGPFELTSPLASRRRSSAEAELLGLAAGHETALRGEEGVQRCRVMSEGHTGVRA